MHVCMVINNVVSFTSYLTDLPPPSPANSPLPSSGSVDGPKKEMKRKSNFLIKSKAWHNKVIKR